MILRFSKLALLPFMALCATSAIAINYDTSNSCNEVNFEATSNKAGYLQLTNMTSFPVKLISASGCQDTSKVNSSITPGNNLKFEAIKNAHRSSDCEADFQISWLPENTLINLHVTVKRYNDYDYDGRTAMEYYAYFDNDNVTPEALLNKTGLYVTAGWDFGAIRANDPSRSGHTDVFYVTLAQFPAGCNGFQGDQYIYSPLGEFNAGEGKYYTKKVSSCEDIVKNYYCKYQAD